MVSDTVRHLSSTCSTLVQSLFASEGLLVSPSPFLLLITPPFHLSPLINRSYSRQRRNDESSYCCFWRTAEIHRRTARGGVDRRWFAEIKDFRMSLVTKSHLLVVVKQDVCSFSKMNEPFYFSPKSPSIVKGLVVVVIVLDICLEKIGLERFGGRCFGPDHAHFAQ